MPKKAAVEQKYFSVDQIAEMFGLTPQTIRKWLKDGELPYHQLSTQTVRISADDVEALLRRSRRRGA